MMMPLLVKWLLLFYGLSSFAWAADEYTGKRVYYVASYHQGYPWSDAILKTIQDIFADKGIIFEHLNLPY
jgi:hypothetical protein